MNKILTISVAAYNVEKFLVKTIESCTNIDESILDKIEIFIVDDGSKDGTKRIGQKFQEQFPKSVFYVAKENGGHGSTVNYSMEHATGKYFMLLDGDDWVDSNQFEQLVKKLETEDSDVISCTYNMVDNETFAATHVIPNPSYKCDIQYEAKDVLNNAKIYLASLVIKTDILQRHPFKLDEKCFFVDMEYITFPIPYVNTVTFYNLNVYQCRTALAGQSTSRLGTVRHADDHIKVAKALIDFYNSQEGIDNFKRTYIFNMTKKVVEDVYLLPFAFPITDKTIRGKICNFNDYLKDKNLELYHARYRKKINLMRALSYRGWQLLSLLEHINGR